MAKDKLNLTNQSLENKSVHKGGATQTHYASAKVLAKASGQGRPEQYKLENVGKKV